MSRIDFYQLSRDPVEAVVPLLARKAMEAGARLVVIHREAGARAALSDALWADRGFLAHGTAGGGYEARQPILLAEDHIADNGANIALIADGEWRAGAEGFERVLLLFGAERTDNARTLWRELGDGEHTLHIFKQRPDGAWREGR